jgi:hypothetical protein
MYLYLKHACPSLYSKFSDLDYDSPEAKIVHVEKPKSETKFKPISGVAKRIL